MNVVEQMRPSVNDPDMLSTIPNKRKQVATQPVWLCGKCESRAAHEEEQPVHSILKPESGMCHSEARHHSSLLPFLPYHFLLSLVGSFTSASCGLEPQGAGRWWWHSTVRTTGLWTVCAGPDERLHFRIWNAIFSPNFQPSYWCWWIQRRRCQNSRCGKTLIRYLKPCFCCGRWEHFDSWVYFS